MKFRLPLVFMSISVLICVSAEASNFDLYGPDNRQDLYQVTDPLVRKVADSSVALFTMWKFGWTSDGRVPVNTDTLQSSQNLCKGQAFETQPTAPYCSGVLVAPDVVLTAGHCATGWLECLGIRIAFGYAVEKPGKMPTSLAASDVYGCKEVIHSQSDDNEPDFALIRLDRPVQDHAPLELDRTSSLQVGDSVFAIGYPNGLPLKVAAGSVREVDDTDFTADLDIFSGNSGSPVFSARTGLIEGIVVDGGDDFVKKGSCNVLKQYPVDGGPGAGETSASAILPYLPK